MSKNNANKFSPEVRERAVRLEQESRSRRRAPWRTRESVELATLEWGKRLPNTPLTVLLMQQVATDAAAAQRSGCFSASAAA